MRIDGFKCDQCGNLYNQSLVRGILPPDWFALTKGNSSILGSVLLGNTEKHFCSLECLISWASSQIVNPTGIDTGGPVIALSGEEFERRFGKYGKE